MQSEIGIDIAAPPDLVFALARDVTRWSQLLPHYVRSRAARHDADGRVLVEFVARRGFGPFGIVGLLVGWRALTWSEPANRRLRFVHQGGATSGMDVTWRIEPGADGSGTRVTIQHDHPAPRAWALFIDRWFTRSIASRTLATFRAIAEAVDPASSADTSGSPPATYHVS